MVQEQPPMDVVILGLDRDPDLVARNLGHLFGIDLPHARRIVRSVPCVAKREIPANEAARYVRALGSSGCRAEARPSEPRTVRPTSGSLPPPRQSTLPEIEAEERAAVARWRQAEGLDPLAPMPARSSRELARSVPRAARIPGGLALEQLPDTGVGRAGWLTDDPGELGLGSSGPAPSFDPHTRNTLSGRPGAIGVARSGAPEPGSIRTGSDRTGAQPASAARWLRWVAAGLALLLVAGFGLWSLREAEAAKLSQRWSAVGIRNASPYMPHAAWSEDPDNRLLGSRAERTPALLAALERSGVRGVWVIGYSDEGDGRVASRLVVELPQAPTERQTALWQLARFHGDEAGAGADPGGAFVEVDLH